MNAERPQAAEVLDQLSTSLSRMLELLQVMVATIRPPSANTLPNRGKRWISVSPKNKP